MSKNLILSALFLSLMLCAATAYSGAPVLVGSSPPDGANNVPLSQGKVVLEFSENMKMSSWSLMESASHPFPPIRPIEEPWIDPLTFEFEIVNLKPGTTYAVQLNGKKRKGFLSSADQTPLPITTIEFSTAADDSLSPQKLDSRTSVSPPTPPVTQVNGKATKQVPINPGWRFKVTRSIGMDGTETNQSGEQYPFRAFMKIVFLDEVSKASEDDINEVVRQIGSAERHSLDPNSGEMVEEKLVPPGTLFRVLHAPYGSTLVNEDSGEEIWDTEMVSLFAPPMVSRLWPEGDLQVGQKWVYKGAELVNKLALLDALGGQINLQVDSIKPESSTGLSTAFIRGTLKTKVDLGMVVLDYDAKVEIDLPLAVGVPLMIKFDGRLSGVAEGEDEWGKPVRNRIEGTGSVLQVITPSNKVIGAAGGQVAPEEEPVDTTGAFRIPVSGNMNQGVPDTGRTGAGKKGSSSGAVVDISRENAPVYRYRMYEDPTERAFTVMIPEGWKAEGGIMQIPQHQIRTVIDGCGKKLNFLVYDPSSQAFIHYFPTEIYHSTYNSYASPGQVLNGMVQLPRLLSPSEYIREMLFPSSRPDASNVQWGERKNLAQLATAWNQAFHAEDKVPARVISESIEVAYDRGGTKIAELWTALVTSYSASDSTVWTPDFAVVAGGPLATVEDVAPVLKAVITSFRMDPKWVANMIVNYEACTKQVVAEHGKIREMERKIQAQMSKVQKEMRRIDNDILGGQSDTRSTIQEHEYNTLMGNDEYEDTETGNRYVIDLGYERNYTDGRTIIQTNDMLFEPPPEYRQMRNINITDQ